MDYLVRPSIAGNAKKMQNWSTLPRNFSATAGNKNSRLVPKLVLRHALSGNTQYKQSEKVGKILYRLFLFFPINRAMEKKQPASRKKGPLH